MFHIYLFQDKAKEDKLLEPSPNDLPSAYLGPQIWNDMLLSDDLKLEPVDLEDLLDGSNGDDEVCLYLLLSDLRFKRATGFQIIMQTLTLN